MLISSLILVAVMTLPTAYFLRWLMEWHAPAMQAPQGYTRIMGLVALTLAVGLGFSYFMKDPDRAVEATRFIHEFSQNPTAEQNPLAGVAGVSERGEVPYVIHPITSQESTEGFVLHVEYEDGYRFQCRVVVCPGRKPFPSGGRTGE